MGLNTYVTFHVSFRGKRRIRNTTNKSLLNFPVKLGMSLEEIFKCSYIFRSFIGITVNPPFFMSKVTTAGEKKVYRKKPANRCSLKRVIKEDQFCT